MKSNSVKSYLIMSCNEAHTAMIDGLPTEPNKRESLLEISPPLLYEVFAPHQYNHDLPGNKFLEKQRVKSGRYGTESMS